MSDQSLRKTVYSILERSNRTDKLGYYVDIALIILIAVNVVLVVLETVDTIYARYTFWFTYAEYFSIFVFTIEYLLRIWACVEDEKLEGVRNKRLKYMLSPLALIDLLAILPFFLTILFVIDLRFLRVMRLLRVFKLTRYSSAMTMLMNVFREEAHAFSAAFFILMVLLVLAASGAYLAEHDIQPDKFGSIPEAMWWAMATLTTVGYGDVTPITATGKIFGSLVAVIGIGMAALPAGILASGLADQLRRSRKALSDELRLALEDGVINETETEALEVLRKQLGLSRTVVADVTNEIHREKKRGDTHHCPHCGKVLHK